MQGFEVGRSESLSDLIRDIVDIEIDLVLLELLEQSRHLLRCNLSEWAVGHDVELQFPFLFREVGCWLLLGRLLISLLILCGWLVGRRRLIVPIRILRLVIIDELLDLLELDLVDNIVIRFSSDLRELVVQDFLLHDLSGTTDLESEDIPSVDGNPS